MVLNRLFTSFNFTLQKCNSFGIIDEDFQIRGTAIYHNAAAMNHSCKPNAFVILEDNNRLYLRALKDISSGTEITHSYISIGLPLELRQVLTFHNIQ